MAAEFESIETPKRFAPDFRYFFVAMMPSDRNAVALTDSEFIGNSAKGKAKYDMETTAKLLLVRRPYQIGCILRDRFTAALGRSVRRP